MFVFFIFGLLLGGASVYFALQNMVMITVNFFNWSVTASLAVILLSAIGSGVLITFLLFIPGSIHHETSKKKLREENRKLHDELRKEKEKAVFSKNLPPTDEDLIRIGKGAIF